MSGLTSSLVVGQYLPADSPLHRLDPRGKLIVSLTFAIVLFLVDEWVGLGVLGLGLLTAVVVARTPLFYLCCRRADDLAVAMTSRCYRGGEGRTRYREMAFAIGDVVFLLLVCVWLVTAWRLVSLWG